MQERIRHEDQTPMFLNGFSVPHAILVEPQIGLAVLIKGFHLPDIMPPKVEAFTRCTSHPRNGYATCSLWRCLSWFALLSAASRVKSRRAVLSMTHRLTLPYSLDSGVLSIPGEIFLADGRMYDGAWFRSPPLHSGGESDRSFAVKAQALFLAGPAPAG